MTNERPQHGPLLMSPFLARFAQPLTAMPVVTVRYDATRQITQVLADGTWVDAPDATDPSFATTRLTRVLAETTDDA
jgi:hypothetical protein